MTLFGIWKEIRQRPGAPSDISPVLEVAVEAAYLNGAKAALRIIQANWPLPDCDTAIGLVLVATTLRRVEVEILEYTNQIEKKSLGI
jgi:hypothetical protein